MVEPVTTWPASQFHYCVVLCGTPTFHIDTTLTATVLCIVVNFMYAIMGIIGASEASSFVSFLPSVQR